MFKPPPFPAKDRAGWFGHGMRQAGAAVEPERAALTSPPLQIVGVVTLVALVVAGFVLLVVLG